MAKTLKILHVFSTFAVGGQQRRFAQLVDGLEACSHVVAAMDGKGEALSLLARPERCQWRDLLINKGGFLDLGNIKRLRMLIHDEAPDLLCTYNWGAMEVVVANGAFLSRARPVPHLHFEDGFGPDEGPERQHQRRVWARRLFLRGSRVVVPSQVLASLALAVWRLNPEQVHWQPNGVDLEQFRPGPAVRVASAAEGLSIGFVGALRPEKNLARLLRVFAQTPAAKDAQLLLAGEGPERPKLEEMAREMGLENRVQFVGTIDQPAEFYRGLDVFMLTSDTEQMPISVLEAMATGLPVLASRVGDLAQMVSTMNQSAIVAPKDEAGFCTVLEDLLTNSARRQAMGAANKDKAMQMYGLDKMVSAYGQLFQEVAGQ